MSWPFLYFPGDRLSSAELTGARLDGDLVEIGEAYMPADAVETTELRAASLRERVPYALALTRQSAAWVYGAIPDAPARHTVQRRSAQRLHHVLDSRLAYRDARLPVGAACPIGGVWVTTVAQTLADLVRALHAGESVQPHIEGMLVGRPGLAAEALAALEGGRSVHFKRPARAYLRRLVADDAVRTT